jgi:hypothetical protein
MTKSVLSGLLASVAFIAPVASVAFIAPVASVAFPAPVVKGACTPCTQGSDQPEGSTSCADNCP